MKVANISTRGVLRAESGPHTHCSIKVVGESPSLCSHGPFLTGGCVCERRPMGVRGATVISSGFWTVR